MTAVQVRRLWCVIMTVAAAACGSGADAPRGLDDVEAAIRSVMDTFLLVERERDAEAVVRLLAPDFYMYVDGARQGYDSVAAQIRGTMPSLQRMEPTWENMNVHALGPNYALVTFTFRDLIVDAAGNTMRLRGPTTLVWRRGETGWMMIYADADHYPDSVP